MSITSRINPWDSEVIAQLLMRIPKRLDMFTNFHHFSSNLPSVKVGKNVDLGFILMLSIIDIYSRIKSVSAVNRR